MGLNTWPNASYFPPMAKRTKPREIWPMPVQAIVENPLALSMPGAAFGALLRLCFHYWVTNAIPLPESSNELQTISRAVSPIWVKHKAAILQAFSEVKPSLDAYRKKRLSNELYLDFSRAKADSLRRKAKLANVAQPPTVPGIVPRTIQKAPKADPKPRLGAMKERIPIAM